MEGRVTGTASAYRFDESLFEGRHP
jgi:hypothetical protein